MTTETKIAKKSGLNRRVLTLTLALLGGFVNQESFANIGAAEASGGTVDESVAATRTIMPVSDLPKRKDGYKVDEILNLLKIEGPKNPQLLMQSLSCILEPAIVELAVITPALKKLFSLKPGERPDISELGLGKCLDLLLGAVLLMSGKIVNGDSLSKAEKTGREVILKTKGLGLADVEELVGGELYSFGAKEGREMWKLLLGIKEKYLLPDAVVALLNSDYYTLERLHRCSEMSVLQQPAYLRS